MLDRLKQAISVVVRGMVPGIDYYGWYRARMVGPSRIAGDHTVCDVVPDDKRIPPMQGLRLKLGLPGATAIVSPGAFVLVGWEGGDPQHPQVALWDGGESTVKLVVKGAAIFLGDEAGAEFAAKGVTLQGYLNTAAGLLLSHTHPVSGAVAGPSLVLAGLEPVPPVAAALVSVA